MSTLRVNNLTNIAGGPTYAPGHVVQVVQWRRPTYVDTTGGANLLATSSTSYANIMSASITPKFSTSKIMVEVVLSTYNNSGSTVNGATRLMRDSTAIDGFVYSSYYQLATKFQITTYKVLDSPGTTSSVTYAVQGRSGSASYTMLFGYADSGGTEHASITLTEVAQ